MTNDDYLAGLTPETKTKLIFLRDRAKFMRDNSPVNNELFSGNQANRLAGIAFFAFNECVLERGRLSKKLVGLLNEIVPNLPYDPIDADAIINKPGHPVRDAMITNEIDCDIEDSEHCA